MLSGLKKRLFYRKYKVNFMRSCCWLKDWKAWKIVRNLKKIVESLRQFLIIFEYFIQFKKNHNFLLRICQTMKLPLREHLWRWRPIFLGFLSDSVYPLSQTVDRFFYGVCKSTLITSSHWMCYSQVKESFYGSIGECRC